MFRKPLIALCIHLFSQARLLLYFYCNIFHLLSFILRVIKTAFKRVDHAAPFVRDGKHIQTPKRSNDSKRPDCTLGVYELDRREFPASFSRRISSPPASSPPFLPSFTTIAVGKWNGDFILIIERTVYSAPNFSAPSADFTTSSSWGCGWEREPVEA